MLRDPSPRLIAPEDSDLHLPGEPDGATKRSSRFVAYEPHCSLGHDKLLKQQITSKAAREEERRPTSSEGLLFIEAPSTPPQTGRAHQRS